jgi:hypothetical protein
MRYLEDELGDKSANTQYFHLKAIRSFYRYALNSPIARDLKIEANPGEAVRFPTPGMFLKARALSEEQVRKHQSTLFWMRFYYIGRILWYQ